MLTICAFYKHFANIIVISVDLRLNKIIKIRTMDVGGNQISKYPAKVI